MGRSFETVLKARIVGLSRKSWSFSFQVEASGFLFLFCCFSFRLLGIVYGEIRRSVEAITEALVLLHWSFRV